ncbi:hypothetical protein EJ06DRAFT_215605 [Trichodelitschia bisporula]|uniref:Uncharacterized protein n=1 Tax=Trichodelitschia bisporula TaxID=703511 RepID=A0A6G1I9L3_9PEZI|nr:hypothetical protein EJ06DRAFT_215605 [Trichodelitschia bisporula]
MVQRALTLDPRSAKVDLIYLAPPCPAPPKTAIVTSATLHLPLPAVTSPRASEVRTTAALARLRQTGSRKHQTAKPGSGCSPEIYSTACRPESRARQRREQLSFISLSHQTSLPVLHLYHRTSSLVVPVTADARAARDRRLTPRYPAAYGCAPRALCRPLMWARRLRGRGRGRGGKERCQGLLSRHAVDREVKLREERCELEGNEAGSHTVELW